MRKKKEHSGDGKRQRYYALLEEWIGPIEGNNYSRSSVLLDGVDASRFDENTMTIGDPSALSLVRAMSTDRVWLDRHQLREINKGDWVEISLGDAGGGPMAWELRADDDYRRSPRRSVEGIRRIGRLLPEGGATGDQPELVERLHAAINVARGEHRTISFQSLANRILAGIRPLSEQDTADDRIEILVLDVGQASANLIRRNGVPVALFDVGSPLWFNRKSFNPHFRMPDLGGGFIFLSHWDFDHFDLGRRHAPWHKNDWFAPDQVVGPNTALFQKKLGRRLKFVDGPLIIGGFRFERGTSIDPVDRNNNGYQMRYERDTEAVLLTGDADYEFIAPHMKAGLTHLCIPHHGGKGTSPPSPASGFGRAVVSYGMPNSYRHPHAPQIVILRWRPRVMPLERSACLAASSTEAIAPVW